ncbi:hypothetical protein DFH06DRAFT_1447108 [Mycena polygramma]|nr:hypothetical protein DFH06DRAFT_1447108 [Mycena polygramma]
MHRCLNIPELVDLIFGELQCPLPNQALGHRDFAALARTCKTFLDPALRLLWREQGTLSNLLKCLPSHLWREDTHPLYDGRRVLQLIGPIHTGDWSIPLSYALRIHTLKVDSWDKSVGFSALDDIFHRISSGLPRDHLCPNLTSITWNSGDDHILFPYICLFLGPKIVNATISVPTRHVPSLLDLALRYPQLKGFSLRNTSRIDLMLSPAVSKIISSLERIEDLSFDQLDRASLEHLSRLPSLRLLCLETPDFSDLPRSRDERYILDPQYHPFPALREVYFEDTTIDLTIEFLGLMSKCHLETFHVGTVVSATKLITGQLYFRLAKCLSHSALHALEIELPSSYFTPTRPPLDAVADYVVDGVTLAALFCFTNLTELNLVPPVGFDIDDSTAWEMAQALPKIKSLHLGAATDLHYPSSMSLHGLPAFAKHCGDLENLSINFDASTVPTDNLSESISQCSLTSLDTNASPITDPLPVAQFMAGLFPNLAKIWHGEWLFLYDEEDDDDDEMAGIRITAARWKQVETILQK